MDEEDEVFIPLIDSRTKQAIFHVLKDMGVNWVITYRSKDDWERPQVRDTEEFVRHLEFQPWPENWAPPDRGKS